MKVDCIPAFHTFSVQVPVSNSLIPSDGSGFIKENTKLLPDPAVLKVEVTEDKNFLYADTQNRFIDFCPLNNNLSYSPPEKDGNKLIISKNSSIPDRSDKTGLLVFQDTQNSGISGIYARLERNSALSDDNTALLPLLWIIFSAFLGGMLLNFMPCVFPVLALKVFGLGKLGGSDRKKQIVNSLSYQAGASFFFLSLAVILWIVRQSGSMIGWGFQLQSPGFVFALSCLFVVLGSSYLELPMLLTLLQAEFLREF